MSWQVCLKIGCLWKVSLQEGGGKHCWAEHWTQVNIKTNSELQNIRFNRFANLMHHMKTFSNLNCAKIHCFLEIPVINQYWHCSIVYFSYQVFPTANKGAICVVWQFHCLHLAHNIWSNIWNQIWAKFGTTLEQCLLCAPVAGCCLQLAQDIWSNTWNHFWAIFGTTLALYASCWVLFTSGPRAI